MHHLTVINIKNVADLDKGQKRYEDINPDICRSTITRSTLRKIELLDIQI